MRDRDRYPGEPYPWRLPPVPLSELQDVAANAIAGDCDGQTYDPPPPMVPGDFNTPAFRARLTAGGSGAVYSFVETALTTDGSAYEDVPNGFSGTLNALERNGYTDIPTDASAGSGNGKRVMMRSAGGPGGTVYDFFYPSASPPPNSTVTYDNVKITGTTRLDSLTQEVTNNSSFTIDSGKTLEVDGPGAFSLKAPVSIPDDVTFSIASTKTLEMGGSGTFKITSGLALDGTAITVPNSATLGISSGKTLEVDGPGAFALKAPLRTPMGSLTLANGANTLALSSLTSNTMRITGPTAPFSITAISGSYQDGDSFTIINPTTQTLTLPTGGSFSIPADDTVPPGGSFSIKYDGASSLMRIISISPQSTGGTPAGGGTTLTANGTTPGPGGGATFTVADASSFIAGQLIWCSDGSHGFYGAVTSASGTSVSVTGIGVTAGSSGDTIASGATFR